MRLKILLLAVSIVLTCLSISYAGEKITLSTFYPAPYGEYDELTANKMVIGPTYAIPTNPGDLIVEGKVGIGINVSPSEELEVNGNIIGTPIMGTWYPTAHGPTTPGGEWIYVIFDASQNVTDASYFTNLGGSAGIHVHVAGYYHVEFVALVYLGSAGDYGHTYLLRNGGGIDLDHSHPSTGTSWDDRHCSWKGYMAAGDYIQVMIYHQVATTYVHHNGPLYTRLTIQRLN